MGGKGKITEDCNRRLEEANDELGTFDIAFLQGDSDVQMNDESGRRELGITC